MKQKLGKRLQRHFITGLVVITPIALSIYIFWKIFVIFDNWMAGFLEFFFVRVLGIENYYYRIPGLGILVLILLTILIGILTRLYIGRKLIDLGNWIVGKIPFFNTIYLTLKQITEALFSDRGEVFRKAVLLEYPRRGIYSIAFMTQDTRGEVQSRIEDDLISVFLPTTPNPTSGFLLFVPKKDVKELNMSIEEALKLVISGGAVNPEVVQDPQIREEDKSTFSLFGRNKNKKKQDKK